MIGELNPFSSMVQFDKDYKSLNVPAGLGNPSGNESVSGVTPEEVEIMIDEALVDYPTTAVTEDLQQQIDAISGGTGTDVQWDQRVSAGTKIAEITIDGNMTEVYAPTSGGGGVTPQDVQDAIDSALTQYSTTQEVEGMLGDYATTAETQNIQSQVNGKQDTLSAGTNIEITGNTINCTITDYAKDYYVNWAELRTMTQQERIDYFATLTQKVQDGYTVYAVGRTNADSYEIKIPLVEFRAEETGIAGWARFAGISTKNITGVTEGYNIIYASYNSGGYTYPDTPYLDRTLEFYELPTADANTLGGVKVGSGLTIDANGVLSATGGGGGGSSPVVSDGVVWVEGVPACAAPFTDEWCLDGSPYKIDYDTFRSDPSAWYAGDVYRYNYRGYNIGDTIQTPAYISFLNGMLMYNSYVRLINNADDSVEIVLISWGGELYYNTDGDPENLAQGPVSLNLNDTTAITGANGVVFNIECYTDNTDDDTDTYKLCKWRINSITGGSVRVDDRDGYELFQTLLCQTPGEPDAPDAIKYKGRKSWYLHPPVV